ncbi:hypothetical protein SSX86_013066 [Deinandra increscens subsp. villosa]|uniref:WEB family protein n=1 Tax=Deinandra increscens subsp. villosa TaxID=3103831 RepID=A0AAP0D5C5_9ASTR
MDSDHNVGPGFLETGSDPKQINGDGVRGEVDTSAPFGSVKEAVTRFGGVGFWKPHPNHLLASQNGTEEEFDPVKAEEQAVQLANNLMLKEKEALEVLKELESTKAIVEELKVKLQKELSTQSTGFILTELQQAKLNLTRTTNDLANIRATMETYNKMIEKERFELEKTRQRFSQNSSEEVDFSRELHRLTSETGQFKKVTEEAKSEVLRSMNQIKQTKRRIKTAEMRLIAARKLKEAARASEALARFEINSLSESQTREVNESAVKVNEPEVCKSEILNKVEEATEEVKKSKRVLEEALSKAEAANIDNLEAEEALRKWGGEHGQRRKSTVQNSTKFKNSCSRSNSHSGSNVTAGPILAPTMSIGQILNRKLLLTEEYYEKSDMRRKVCLAQMLSKPANGGGSGSGLGGGGGDERVSGKRKKFGIGRIPFLAANSSKKKKHTASLRLSGMVD